MSNPITIPLINPNEPEALLASLFVEEGQAVSEGDLICTLETTKATSELRAEGSGYIAGLRFSEGATVAAGAVLAYLAADRDWKPPESPPETEKTAPKGLRITQPARDYATEHGIPLESLPTDRLVTLEAVKTLAAGTSKDGGGRPPDPDFDPAALVIYGGGGHGKSVIELVRALGVYRIHGILDDGMSSGSSIMGHPVLGGGEALRGLFERGVRQVVNAVGGIGNISVRMRVFEAILKAGMECPSVVHPKAFVETSARLEGGVQVFPFAYIGSDARTGFGAIVNTAAVVSHDCTLGEYANISPGALLAGGVRVGRGALVGMGVTVNLGVRIGERARVGNGAAVKADVPDGGVVRAGAVWPSDQGP